jgi:three-Cys-motif partner protein
MSSTKNKNLWDVTDRPHTKTKLQMLHDIFNIWLTIWGGPRQQKWVAKDWYVIDLFAGKGCYEDMEKEVNGSPFIFLEEVASKEKTLIKNSTKIRLFFVEILKKNFNELQKRVSKFVENHPTIENVVELNFYNKDCNETSEEIISMIANASKNPLFLCIDPYGINIHKETIRKYLNLDNPIDIFFNYSKEGVTRTQGLVQKPSLASKEVKTVNSLKEFIGEDVDYKTKKDLALLYDYIETLFVKSGYSVVGFDMEYPTRKDVLYYLLFASKNNFITDRIVKSIYANYKERIAGPTLFGRDFYLDSILSIPAKVKKVKQIKRKTLLYKTKVEYGDWTINHIIGCMHGCKFPCYAMRMAQKFGWVKNYKDWRKPRIAVNAMELLENEIPKYKSEIDFVHLCFMSDPFMYDIDEDYLIPEVKELTLRIIEKLNKEGIRATTLTKGFYPDEVLDKKRFLRTNEYGITLVSLDNKFKEKFEPFSAPYEKRIKSLMKLAKAGLKTWVSIEPYPTPELDKTADNIEALLEKVKFVSKIIFGKLNYRRLNYNNGPSQVWENNHDFYRRKAQNIIDFCRKNDIEYHIKFGTPLSKKNTIDIFKNNHTLKNR